MNSLQKGLWLAFLLSAMCLGEISTKLYLRDSNELLIPVEVNTTLQYVDYGQVMEGTQLAILVESNAVEFDKYMSLYIEDDNRNYGILSSRGPDYSESIYNAAGKEFGAAIYPVDGYWPEENKYMKGFDFVTGSKDVNTGDWFVFDYNTLATGNCDVAFYQWEYPDAYLIHELWFTHVPTRDFDNDGIVNFDDFSILASYWYDSNCGDPNSCQGVNLDNYGVVDINDLMLFTDYWLVKTR